MPRSAHAGTPPSEFGSLRADQILCRFLRPVYRRHTRRLVLPGSSLINPRPFEVPAQCSLLVRSFLCSLCFREIGRRIAAQVRLEKVLGVWKNDLICTFALNSQPQMPAAALQKMTAAC